MDAAVSPLAPEVGAEPETMLRGSKMRIYPTRRQMQIMDLWRRRNISLWNLLLQLQQAAYNGENTRSKLGWRKIWAQVVEDDHEAASHVYAHGKIRKSDGAWIKEPGIGREEEREALKTRLKHTKVFRERQQLKERLRKIAGEPKPLDPTHLEKIRWKWRWDGAPLPERLMHKLFGSLGKSGKDCDHTHRHTLAWLEKQKLSATADELVAWLRDHGGVCDCTAVKTAAKRYAEICKECQPRLLFSQANLLAFQKLMARLKQHPQTAWIGDLPSHTSQKTVADMVAAIDSMLREKGKAARGEASRKTGFPAFKPQHYAAGSVYFANTQLKFALKHGAPGRATPKGEEFGRVKLPNGVGWMECRMNRAIGAAHEYGQATLMGGRIWRQGEDWYISCQWTVSRPEPLPKTGRMAGVKIAAAIPITIYDDRGQTREYVLPAPDKQLSYGYKQAGRDQARSLEGRKAKIKKLEARKKRQRERKGQTGIVETAQGPVRLKELTRPRVPLSPAFYRAARRLATLEARDADVRNEWLHQITTAIVRQFDVIAVQKMEVARMMKKPKPAESAQPAEGADDKAKPAEQGRRRSLKAARVMMRRTAMARIQTTLKYKALDLRGADAYEELEPLYPTVQPCSRCGVIHPEMKAGKPVLRCAEQLPDGTICGNRLTRNRNAARIVTRELEQRIRQRKEAAG